MTTRSEAIRGARHLAVAIVAAKGFGFGGQLVLTRVLTQEHFGAFALAISIVTLLGTLGNFESRRDILRDPTSAPRRARAYLVLQGSIGVLLAALIVLLGPSLLAVVPAVRSGNGAVSAAVFLQALCAIPLLEGLRLPALVLVEARGNYRAIARVEIWAAAVQVVGGIAMAIAGAGTWALVGGFYASAIVRFAGTWWLERGQCLRERVTRADFTGVLRFAVPMLAASLLTAWYWKIDDIIVGCGLGLAAAGLYSIAFELPRAVFQLTEAMSRVALGVLGRRRRDIAAQRRVFGVAVRASFVLLAPVTLLCLVHGELLLGTVFGSKWVSATPAFQVFCVLVLLRGTFRHWSDVATTAGRPEFMTRAALAAAVALPLFSVWGIRHGILGMAFAVLAAWCVPAPFYLLWIQRRLDMRFRELLGPCALSFVVALGCGILLVELAGGAPGALARCMIGGIQLAVFGVLLFQTDRGLCGLLLEGLRPRAPAVKET
ncbi:MAG: oligosaccharide flippase family protein [Planctomycetota bacterium]|nr:oligosaccharide flippase family protein [Planctomycetota bacterium]